jgi:hypothetical protein
LKVNIPGNARPLHSNNLVPFKKRREAYHLPVAGGHDGAESALERIDPGLSAEEQSYVRRYLAYANSFLENAPLGPRAGKNGDAWLHVESENKKEAAA